jgi:hypothetical protein
MLRAKLLQIARRQYYVPAGTKNTLAFVDDAEDYDLTRTYSQLSLDKFYGSIADFKLSDEDAIMYM